MAFIYVVVLASRIYEGNLKTRLARLAGEWKSSFQTLLQTPGISSMYGRSRQQV